MSERVAGGHLCQERAAVRGPGATPHRAELPRHRHPQGHEPGGEAVALPTVQGFPKGNERGFFVFCKVFQEKLHFVATVGFGYYDFL